MFANAPCIHAGFTHMMWSALLLNSRPHLHHLLLHRPGCALIISLVYSQTWAGYKLNMAGSVRNCLAVRGTTGIAYLSRPVEISEEGLICLLSPDLRELVMFS